jgi:hypothetical protein
MLRIVKNVKRFITIPSEGEGKGRKKRISAVVGAQTYDDDDDDDGLDCELAKQTH